jgi:probable rRNA maturation factor
MSVSRVVVIVDDPLWRNAGAELVASVRRAVRSAFESAKEKVFREATVLLTNDAKLQELNRKFRRKSKPTNVLSFPSPDARYAGDIAIAYGVTSREARKSGKSIHDHALHLAVHGALHLLGYDHETAREARIMEPLEVQILAKLGVADPYAARKTATATN